MQLARTYKTYETTKSLKRERSLFEPTCQNSLNFRIAFKVSVNNPLDVSARICVFRCQKRFQLRHQSNCGKHDFSWDIHQQLRNHSFPDQTVGFQQRCPTNSEERTKQQRKAKLEDAESKLRNKKGFKKSSSELQDAPTELQSHDLPDLSRDCELPTSREGLRPSSDLASAGRRRSVDGGNICLRRGPQSFLAS